MLYICKNIFMEAVVEKKRETLTHRALFAGSTRLQATSHSKVLMNFIANRSKKSLKDLRGEICFRDDYDYKLMRG